MSRLSVIISRWLVVALLLFVAVSQFVRARADTLSPWKGGGFGMFAAIDSPGMRIISAVGIDSEGVPHRVDPLASLPGSERRKLRSYPRREELQQLARDLVDAQFVPSGARVSSALEQLRVENPGAVLGLRYRSRFNGPVYRTRKLGDPELPPEVVRRFETIVVESWRLDFDPASARLTVKRLLPAIEASQGAPR